MARHKKEAVEPDDLYDELDSILADDNKFESVKYWMNTGCDLTNWAISLGGHGYPGGHMTELSAWEGCLAADTRILYQVNAPDDGRVQSCKGGTIEQLFYRTHGLVKRGSKILPAFAEDQMFSASSVNEEGRIVKNRILKVVYSGVRDCLEIVTETGGRIEATADHKFLSGEDFVAAGDLKVGTPVMMHNNVPYRIEGGYEAAHRPDTTVKHHPHGALNREHACENHNKLRFTVLPERVTSITEVGPRDTYDIQMAAPYNNFVANRFVVHNSGKTQQVLQAAAKCQKEGGKPFFIDIERGLSREWAERNGVILPEPGCKATGNQMDVRKPNSLEGVLAMVERIVEYRRGLDVPTLIAVDSIASGGTCAAAERDTLKDKQLVADQASLLSGWFKNKGILRAMDGTKIVLLMVSQLRSKVGVMFGNPETTPGGATIPFYSWVRLRIRKGEAIQPATGPALGYFCNVQVLKNKVDRPGRKISFPVYWKFGTDNSMSLLLYIQNNKLLPAEGNFITWNGTKITKRKMRDNMLADQGLYDEVRELVHAHFKET